MNRLPLPGMTGRYPISSTIRSEVRHRKRIRSRKLSFPFSPCEDADDIGQAGKVDAAARLHSFNTQCRCEMALAGSRRSRKWITSLRSMKSGWASARTRLRSSEGWNEKSNPASVLMVESLAVRSAILTRRFSRRVSSSQTGCRSPPAHWLHRARIDAWFDRGLSRALGIFRPTRVRRMRSRTEGTISWRSWPFSLLGQASANGLIEAEGASGDDVTGAQDQNWFVAIGPCDPCHLAMAGGDTALMAALQDRMAGRARAATF